MTVALRRCIEGRTMDVNVLLWFIINDNTHCLILLLLEVFLVHILIYYIIKIQKIQKINKTN